VTGVTWVELPPDAPEPPPLSVVRDRVGDWWVHGPIDPMADESAYWHNIGGGLDSDTERGASTVWSGVLDSVPLKIAEPSGVLWPVAEGVEPSAYEVRHAALDAAARATRRDEGEDADEHADNVLWTAERFEGYLRDGTRPEA